MDTIILASKSPRRVELLEKAGFSVISKPSDVDESGITGETPQETVINLSYAKASDVKSSIEEELSESGLPIVGADTIVYSDHIIGKPLDRDDALSILMSLEGKAHKVYTGVTVLLPSEKKEVSFCEETTVYFKSYTPDELDSYLDSTEPYDKAGAYAIQGYFGRYIDRIEGSYSNVMGLPMERLLEELNRLR